jgi:hypothetical protein
MVRWRPIIGFFLAPLAIALPLWPFFARSGIAALYGWTALVGIPAFAVLRRRRWLRCWQVALAAGLGALVFAVLYLGDAENFAPVPTVRELGFWLAAAALFLALGGLAGACFWFIALWRAAPALASASRAPRRARAGGYAALAAILLPAWLFIGVDRRIGEWGEIDDTYFIKRHPTLQLVFGNPAQCGECDVPQSYDWSTPEFVAYCRVRFDLAPELCFKRMRDWQSFADHLASDSFAPFLDRCWPRLDLDPALCYERFVEAAR